MGMRRLQRDNYAGEKKTRGDRRWIQDGGIFQNMETKKTLISKLASGTVEGDY